VSYAGALCIQSGYNVVQDCINQLLEPSKKQVKNELPPTTLPSPLPPFRQAGSAFQTQRPPPTTEPESAPPTNARLADFVLAPEPPTKARIVDGLTRPPRSLQPLGTSSGFIVLAAPFAGPCGSVSRRTSPSQSPLYSPPRPRNPFLTAVQLLQISITRWILSLFSPSLGPEWVHGPGFVSIFLGVLIPMHSYLTTWARIHQAQD